MLLLLSVTQEQNKKYNSAKLAPRLWSSSSLNPKHSQTWECDLSSSTVGFIFHSTFSSEVHVVGCPEFSFKAFHTFMLSVRRRFPHSGCFAHLSPYWPFCVTWCVVISLSDKLGALVFLQVTSRMKRSATGSSAFRNEIAASVNAWIVQP